MARQFHNLSGLLRDLEAARRADDEPGAGLYARWLDEVEAADEAIHGVDADDQDEPGLGDESSDDCESDVGDDGPVPGNRQLGLGEPGLRGQPQQRLDPEVGTPSRPEGGEGVPDAAALGGARNGCRRVKRDDGVPLLQQRLNGGRR